MNTFGDIIREWRAIRRFSQLQLSVEAEISSRHVSFLESGRSQPSKTMVLKIADALHMPKQTANQALGAAGYAPAFPNLPPDDKTLKPVRDAVAMMMSNHQPFPAIAIDRCWDIIGANDAAANLLAASGASGAGNLIGALIGASESEFFVNWDETAYLTLARLRSEIMQLGGDPTLERYVDQLARHPRLMAAALGEIDLNQAVIPSIFNIAGQQISLFSTIAQFGAVQDVVAADIRIELMFPADDATRRYFERT